MKEPQHFALTIALADLARVAPNEWDNLLKAWQLHCEDVTKLVIMSPKDMLPVNQGRAREAFDFLDRCKTCIEEAQKIWQSRQSLNA